MKLRVECKSLDFIYLYIFFLFLAIIHCNILNCAKMYRMNSWNKLIGGLPLKLEKSRENFKGPLCIKKNCSLTNFVVTIIIRTV